MSVNVGIDVSEISDENDRVLTISVDSDMDKNHKLLQSIVGVGKVI